MGYYTIFNIHLSSPNKNFVERLKCVSDEQFEGDDKDFYTHTKWYDSRDHLSQVTKEFPNIIVTVRGYGEEGDIWNEYWQNGKFQYEALEIKFKDFSPSKLKEYIKDAPILFN